MRSLERLFAAAILVVCPVFCSGLAAQSATAAAPQAATAARAPPQFDVAAIHPHIPEPHEHDSIWSSPFDGHFNADEHLRHHADLPGPSRCPIHESLALPAGPAPPVRHRGQGRPCSRRAVARPHLRRGPQGERKDGSGTARRPLQARRHTLKRASCPSTLSWSQRAGQARRPAGQRQHRSIRPWAHRSAEIEQRSPSSPSSYPRIAGRDVVDQDRDHRPLRP